MHCYSPQQQAMEIAGAMSDYSVTFLTQAVSGVHSLRGVELDTRHVLLNQFHAMSMVLLWILSYAARIILALLPSLVPVPVLTPTLKKLSTLAEEYDTNCSVISMTEDVRVHDSLHMVDFSKSPIARALTQV